MLNISGVRLHVNMNILFGSFSIIGANAVVSGHVEGDSVYTGNPARKIMTLDEFRDKRKKEQIEEAKKVVLEYKKRFNKVPPESELEEYFFLFRNNDLPAFNKKMKLMRNYNMSKRILKEQKTVFKNYQEFLNYCLKEE